MSGRGRNVRCSLENKSSKFDDLDDPLNFQMNIPFKKEGDDLFGAIDGDDLIREQQRMQHVCNMDTGQMDQHNLYERMSSLERKVEFLLNINTKILVRVDKICANLKSVNSPTDFPIKDKDELEAVDMKIANSREKYIELFKNMLIPNGIVKNISRILDQNLLMEMNYGGISAKAGLSNYVNLNAALFESQKREGYTFNDYKRDVRLAFQKAKNRVYKAVSEARRLKKANNDADESKNGNADKTKV